MSFTLSRCFKLHTNFNWMGFEDAENRTRNQWFAVGLIEISVKKCRRDSYFDCFYIPLLFLVPCILAAFFRVFFLWETNKKKARTNEVVIIFVVAEWTVFSKKNWDVEGFERLICSQMFLNSWLLIPLSFSSLLICSLILDF